MLIKVKLSFVNIIYLVLCLYGDLSTSLSVTAGNNSELSDSCPILCSGEILHHVQLTKVFNDSKHFVDMKLNAESQVIQTKFWELLNGTSTVDRELLLGFVKQWFSESDTELEQVDAEDWQPQPRFIEHVYDIELREWLRKLNKIWPQLLRKTSDDVLRHPELYSLIYLPHPFIVPGGRFKEMYYWDSFWIIEGLLLCEMKETAKEIIENLLYLVEKYGYVPNGSRKYYLGRSQIPFLTPMIELYSSYTNDQKLIEKNLPILDLEFHYWYSNYRVNFEHDFGNYTMFHYSNKSNSPRAESYYEDYTTAQDATDHFYSDVRAAAESGWDFSSRWFLDHRDHFSDHLKDISTHLVVPVDLNSLMCYNARLLASYHYAKGNVDIYNFYKSFASYMNNTIERLLWDDTQGFWFDFNLKTGKLHNEFYGSSFMPLWTLTYGSERNRTYIIEKVLEYIAANNLTSYPAGLPASLRNSSQQWDFPNGWAPLQYFAVLGLHKAAPYYPPAEGVAFNLAAKWVLGNFKKYQSSGGMLEKYDVTRVGGAGSGGEYPVQTGFGWTNGVVMKLLDVYPHSIHSPRETDFVPIVVGVVLLSAMVTSLGMYARATYKRHKPLTPLHELR